MSAEAHQELGNRPQPTGVIKLPSLGLEFVLVDQLDAGATHRNGSSLPGEPGTCAIEAHRTGPFRRLGELQPGDYVYISVTTGGDDLVHRYVVSVEPMVVPEHDPLLATWRVELFDRLGIPGPEPKISSYRRLMLSSCSARDGEADPEDNSHRIVVLADLHAEGPVQ